MAPRGPSYSSFRADRRSKVRFGSIRRLRPAGRARSALSPTTDIDGCHADAHFVPTPEVASKECESGGRLLRKPRKSQTVQEVFHVLLAGENRVATSEHAADEARCEAIENSDLTSGARYVAGSRAAGNHQGPADGCSMLRLDCGLAPAHGFVIVALREVRHCKCQVGGSDPVVPRTQSAWRARRVLPPPGPSPWSPRRATAQ